MTGPMTLQQLVETIDSFDDELTVFRRPDVDLSGDTPVFIVDLNEEDEPEGLKEFMDVWQVRDAIQGKCRVARLVDPDITTKTSLLLDYAEKDA